MQPHSGDASVGDEDLCNFRFGAHRPSVMLNLSPNRVGQGARSSLGTRHADEMTGRLESGREHRSRLAWGGADLNRPPAKETAQVGRLKPSLDKSLGGSEEKLDQFVPLQHSFRHPCEITERGRGAQVERFQHAQDIFPHAVELTIGIRVLRRKLRDFVTRAIDAPVDGEAIPIGVGEEPQRVVIQILESELLKIKLLHHGAAEDVNVIYSPKVELESGAGRKRLRGGGTAAQELPFLQNSYLQPGLRQVTGGDHSVVSATDNDEIAGLHLSP